ncbi:nose resistant to fluoxetine protein 6-like, partial [Asbolus verrucosus]
AQVCELLGNWTENEINTQCLKQLQAVCNNGSVLWRMFDASSKYPITGMSYGNNRDLGNFEQCIDLNYESYEENVVGKFCALSVAIVNIFLDPIPNPFAMGIKPKMLAQVPSVQYGSNLTVSRNLKAATDDFSITLLSLCVPEACTPREVGKFFIWGQLENISLVNFVDSVPCMTKESNTTFEWGDIVFVAFLALIFLLIVWSTAYDWLLQKLKSETRHPILLAFSLLTNGKKLLHISQNNPEQIQCLNGMRFISMMWVIAGHGFIAMESVPLINYATIDEYQDSMKMQYMASAPIAVDTFFFLSGFLLCYGYLKAAAKVPPIKQILGIPMMIVHRYLRLTPALAATYLTAITIFRMTGIGPMWDAVALPMKEQCKKHWWSFFLYVQNYVNYNDICLNHTWYLSADMQMFILSPLVLIPLTILIKQNKTKLALHGLFCLTLICVGFPMLIRFLDHNIDKLNNYLIGIILGVILRQYKSERYPFTKIGGRLSYCMYLLHALVEMYWVGLARTPYYWGDYMIFYNWCGHFVVTMLMSAIWTLAFESPMIVIEKFLFGNANRRPQKRGQD